MDKVLREPLFYIYFIYGLSFLVMSYVVFRGVRRAASITLVTTFYALVLFGLTHGITEWIDWVRFILKAGDAGEIALLRYLSQIFLVVSFVFLLQFGINLLTFRSEKKSIFRSVPILFFIVYIIVLLVQKIEDISEAGLIARYCFGFAGSLLSSIALFKLAGSMKSVGSSRLINGLVVTAVGFASYAIFGGLIVGPVAGLPVQLFRAACAFTIAVSSFSILELFKASK
jgi:hypothetical protein